MQGYSSTLTLTSALDKGGLSTPRPGRFTPGKEARYPLHRRLGGSHGRSRGKRNNSNQCGVSILSLDLPARSESQYRLSYPCPQHVVFPGSHPCNYKPSPTLFNPYPTAFPYGNGTVLHFYQQQESSTTKTVHKVINRGLKAYV